MVANKCFFLSFRVFQGMHVQFSKLISLTVNMHSSMTSQKCELVADQDFCFQELHLQIVNEAKNYK